MIRNLTRFTFCFLSLVLMAQLLSCYQSDRQTSRNNAHTEDKALDLTYQDTLLKFLALQDFRDQSIIAVSYTHLDVYKRQPDNCCKKPLV